jgi:hypothetical protein
MRVKQLFGYILAGLHSIFSWSLVIIAIVTSNFAILISLIAIEILTVISWRLFDNKCPLTILESKFLDGVDPKVQSGKISFFNYHLSRYFSESSISTAQVVRPYTTILISGAKLLAAM